MSPRGIEALVSCHISGEQRSWDQHPDLPLLGQCPLCMSSSVTNTTEQWATVRSLDNSYYFMKTAFFEFLINYC